MGGGGRRGGRSTKKIFAQGKIKWKKNSCTPINPKKYSCYGLKKIHTRNLITKNNSCGSKIPHPHHNFSNGPSLNTPALKIIFNHKRHFALRLLRDMSVIGILFRFIKNSTNQLYTVMVDFHSCVIFTFVRFYILLYFTWTHVKTRDSGNSPQLK